jgi:glutathione S-transferase
MTPVLHQFQFSHYNEKARWALDFKGIAHRRRSLLPGPHMLPMMRLSGQKSVPVLCFGKDVVAGSAQIVDEIEKRHPQPPLYPDSPTERHEALRLQKWFDEEVGPRIRRAFFWDVLPGSTYAAELFLIGRGALAKSLYRAAFPAIRMVMLKDMNINEATAALGVERTREAFDLVAEKSAATGYLVGDRFSVADLTAAALLSPAVMPAQFPYSIPEPRSQNLERWFERWADHPGSTWVRAIYQRHRGTSAEAAGRD